MTIILTRTDPSSEDYLPLLFKTGKHVLGRGEILNCDDRRVSRQHCALELTEEGVATLYSTHKNPCFYRNANNPDLLCVLQKPDKRELHEGDQIALLQDEFWFTVKSVSKNDDQDVSPNVKIVLASDQRDNVYSQNTLVANDSQDESDLCRFSELSDSEILNSCTETLLNSGPSSPSLLGPETQIIPEAAVEHVSISSTQASTSTATSTSSHTPAGLKKSGSGEPDAKRNKVTAPNSPKDVKPDIVALAAAANSMTTTPPTTVKIKTEMPETLKVETIKAEPDSTPSESTMVTVKPDPDGAGPSRPSQSSAVKAEPDSSSSRAGPVARQRCIYGVTCYRKNPHHKIQFSHPGDLDWSLPPSCRWGVNCYCRSMRHRSNYFHVGPPKPHPDDGRQSPNQQRVRIGSPDLGRMWLERRGNFFYYLLPMNPDHLIEDSADSDEDIPDQDYEF